MSCKYLMTLYHACIIEILYNRDSSLLKLDPYMTSISILELNWFLYRVRQEKKVNFQRFLINFIRITIVNTAKKTFISFIFKSLLISNNSFNWEKTNIMFINRSINRLLAQLFYCIQKHFFIKNMEKYNNNIMVFN